MTGLSRAARPAARLERAALPRRRRAELAGRTGHAIARLREAARDALTVDAALSTGAGDSGAGVGHGDARRAADGPGSTCRRRRAQARISLTASRQADLSGGAGGRANRRCRSLGTAGRTAGAAAATVRAGSVDAPPPLDAPAPDQPPLPIELTAPRCRRCRHRRACRSSRPRETRSSSRPAPATRALPCSSKWQCCF